MLSLANDVAAVKENRFVANKPPPEPEQVPKTIPIKKALRSKEGFRGAPWGSSMEFVKSQEPGEFVGERDEIQMYKGTLNHLQVLIGYIFVDNKLVRAQYQVSERHSNKNLHIVDFEGLEELLGKKYGKPTKNQTVWANDMYQGDPQHRGMAISMGHLSEMRTWETRASTIALILSGDNFDVHLVVEYQGKKFKGLEEQKRQKGNLDDL